MGSTAYCLTCNETIQIAHVDPAANRLAIGSGENCLYNSVSFSPNSKYYVLECLGDKIPVISLKNIENSTFECK
jgi:hypothetical protein